MMILSPFCEHPKEEKRSVLNNIKGPRVSTTFLTIDIFTVHS